MIQKEMVAQVVRGDKFVMLMFSPLILVAIFYFLTKIPVSDSELLKTFRIIFTEATLKLSTKPNDYLELPMVDNKDKGIVTICWNSRKTNLKEICITYDRSALEYATLLRTDNGYEPLE